MDNQTELAIAMMQRDIKDLRKESAELQAEVDKLKELDAKRMRAAVLGLAGIVVTLGAYIWAIVIGEK